MIAIRKCNKCREPFDAVVGTYTLTCPACRQKEAQEAIKQFMELDIVYQAYGKVVDEGAGNLLMNPAVRNKKMQEKLKKISESR